MRCPNCGWNISMRGGYRTKCSPQAFKDFYKKHRKTFEQRFPEQHSFQDHHDPYIRILIEQARIYFGYSWKTAAMDIYFRLHQRWRDMKNG